jgi:hypothetical protein
MAVTGEYDHDVAFSAHYRATPQVRIRKDSSLIDISMHIANRSRYPMPLMYMCHINYRPVDYGRIVQSLPWDADHMILRTSIPEHVTLSESFLDFMKRVEEDPSLTGHLNPQDEYRPELALFMQRPFVDSQGLCHFMQIHPDGGADYVGFNPEYLDRPTRWIMRTGEQEALGIALPSTCDPEGYSAEKAKGNVKEIAGNSSVTMEVRTGVLDRSETEAMESHVSSMIT